MNFETLNESNVRNCGEMFARLLFCVIVVISLNECGGDVFSSTNQWRNRSTIVHLFEWKWEDVANECERFLADHGFGGVQVSPVTEHVVVYDENNDNVRRPWWERYQPVSYKLQTRSGDEEAFKSMVKRCNRVGVRIYVDVVLNHLTTHRDAGYGTGGSFYDPENYLYPAIPYTSSKDFHYPPCGMDFNDAFKIRQCELLGLEDLDQSKEDVRARMVEFLDRLIDYGVAGFRIDAARHMWPEDLKVIYGRLSNLNVEHGFEENSRPYIYQEVISLNPGGAISRDDYTAIAPITEFRVGAELSRAFRGNNPLRWLKSWGPTWGLVESKDALAFIDNHDNQRDGGSPVLTFKEAKFYKAAVAFLLAHPYGSSRIMSSYDFQNFDIGPPRNADYNITSPTFNKDGSCTNGWICEHRWREIYQMVAFRNIANGKEISYWWDNGNNQIAFCRGNSTFIAINIESYDLSQNIYTCLPPGTYCDVISGKRIENQCTGKSILVDRYNYAKIEIGTREFNAHMAIHIGDESLLVA